jgi:hypothetical protein
MPSDSDIAVGQMLRAITTLTVALSGFRTRLPKTQLEVEQLQQVIDRLILTLQIVARKIEGQTDAQFRELLSRRSVDPSLRNVHQEQKPADIAVADTVTISVDDAIAFNGAMTKMWDVDYEAIERLRAQIAAVRGPDWEDR